MNLIFVILIFAINSVGIIRYLNQWGDPLSTPTYSLVPMEYFLMWNFLTLSLVSIIIFKFRRIESLTIFFLIFFLLNLTLIRFQTSEPLVLGTINSLVLNGVLFSILISNSKWVNIRYLNMLIEVLTIAIIIFLIYQIINFKINGRLPSHSHEGLLVRFGSIYDDSLVLGIMLPFFAGYFLEKFNSKKFSIVICMLSMGMATLTGSLTSVAIMLIYIIYKIRPIPKIILVTILLMPIIFFEYTYEIWIFKSGSITAHLDGWGAINAITLFSFIGIHPENIYPEPGILSLLLNFGIFILVGIYSLILYCIFRISSSLSHNLISRDLRLLYSATEALLISVFIANFNMPIVIFPPIFLMVSVFSGIVFYTLMNSKFYPTKQGFGV